MWYSFSQGASQLGKYVYGEVVNEPNLILFKGKKLRRGGPIGGSSFEMNGQVVAYWYAGYGVILYNHYPIVTIPERDREQGKSNNQSYAYEEVPVSIPTTAVSIPSESTFTYSPNDDFFFVFSCIAAILFAPATSGQSLEIIMW